MKQAVTYLWFCNGPSKLLPHAVGVVRVDAPTGAAAVEALPQVLGLSADEDIEVSVLSGVELEPGLRVTQWPVYVTGTPPREVTSEKQYMWSDDPYAVQSAVPAAGAGQNMYVVTGDAAEDDLRFIQYIKGFTVEDAVAQLLTWFDEDTSNLGPDDVRVWSVVEERRDGISVYGPLPAEGVKGGVARGVRSKASVWRSGEYQEIPMGAAPAAGAPHPPGLLEKVNRDRARRGQSALAPGEWSTQDLEEFAGHVRNPALQDLKRRLMR